MGLGKMQDARRSCRPAVESLEGRKLLTIYKARSVAELVADIQLASSTPNNTILLAAGRYNLSSEIKIENAQNLTIEGAPLLPGTIRVIGGGSSRDFEVDGGSVTFSGLTISGGSSVDRGGGIYANGANVTISKTTVSENTARQGGGGVFADGSKVVVLHSSINGNNAGGGVSNFGGGIAAFDSQVVLYASAVNSNALSAYALDPQSAVVANGAGVFAQGSVVSIAGSSINRNTGFAATNGTRAASAGGAVASSASLIMVRNSTIETNSLDTITSAVPSTEGSSFSTVGGVVTISNTTITGNSPGNKLLFNTTAGATVTLQNATISSKKLTGSYTLAQSGTSSGG